MASIFLGASRRFCAALKGSRGGGMTQTGCYKRGRRRHIDADRQAGRRRPGSRPASHRLDEGADDAPQADPGADRTRARARLPAPGRCRCHHGCGRHRPRRGDTGPPSGQQPGRHRQRDAHAEGLAGKLIADRHRAAQHRRAGECERRAQQRTIRTRPHVVPPVPAGPQATDHGGPIGRVAAPFSVASSTGRGRTGKPGTGAIDADDHRMDGSWDERLARGSRALRYGQQRV